MADQGQNPQQLETYKNMLDSMVEFLQISSNLMKQRIEVKPTNPSEKECEVECVMCTPTVKCKKCTEAQKAQKDLQIPQIIVTEHKDKCPAQEECIEKATGGTKDVQAAESPKEDEAKPAESEKKEGEEPCVCEQSRIIRNAAAEAGSKECSPEVKRKCLCNPRLNCQCNSQDNKEQMHDVLMNKLESVQKQIDLVRVDIENWSGKSKSAALYKEIMKGGLSPIPGPARYQPTGEQMFQRGPLSASTPLSARRRQPMQGSGRRMPAASRGGDIMCVCPPESTPAARPEVMRPSPRGYPPPPRSGYVEMYCSDDDTPSYNNTPPPPSSYLPRYSKPKFNLECTDSSCENDYCGN